MTADVIFVGQMTYPVAGTVVQLASIDAMKTNSFLRGLKQEWMDAKRPTNLILVADAHLLARWQQVKVLNKAIGLAGFTVIGVMGAQAKDWAEWMDVPVIEDKPRVTLDPTSLARLGGGGNTPTQTPTVPTAPPELFVAHVDTLASSRPLSECVITNLATETTTEPTTIASNSEPQIVAPEVFDQAAQIVAPVAFEQVAQIDAPVTFELVGQNVADEIVIDQNIEATTRLATDEISKESAQESISAEVDTTTPSPVLSHEFVTEPVQHELWARDDVEAETESGWSEFVSNDLLSSIPQATLASVVAENVAAEPFTAVTSEILASEDQTSEVALEVDGIQNTTSAILPVLAQSDIATETTENEHDEQTQNGLAQLQSMVDESLRAVDVDWATLTRPGDTQNEKTGEELVGQGDAVAEEVSAPIDVTELATEEVGTVDEPVEVVIADLPFEPQAAVQSVSISEQEDAIARPVETVTQLRAANVEPSEIVGFAVPVNSASIPPSSEWGLEPITSVARARLRWDMEEDAPVIARAPEPEQSTMNTPTTDKPELWQVSTVKPLRQTSRVRSGQLITNPGDVIVEGAVSSGGEIVAGGDIHIYGVAGGRLLAGVNGDDKACIYVQSFDAELISIAGRYAIFEDVNPTWVGRPIKIHLVNDELQFEPLAAMPKSLAS